MLKNYFVTALRILMRQKAYSFINIFGLTLGITCSLLIILFIVDELSYDRFHSGGERIYRSTFQGRLQGNDFATIQTGVPLAEALSEEVPQVESTLRLFKRNTNPVRYEDKSFTERRFLLADSNFFRFFNFHLVAGNAAEVLKGPNKVVITESAARKYFGYTGKGDTRPLGKIFVLGSQGESRRPSSQFSYSVRHGSLNGVVAWIKRPDLLDQQFGHYLFQAHSGGLHRNSQQQVQILR
jgi:putative ABC transport system permease protein